MRKRPARKPKAQKRAPARRRVGQRKTRACSCADRPDVRGQSFINRGTSQSYVLGSPVVRDKQNCYDCVHDSTEWSLEPTGTSLASLANQQKLSVRVRANASDTGTVMLVATTRSHCKCRPAGDRIDCTEGVGRKSIRIQ